MERNMKSISKNKNATLGVCAKTNHLLGLSAATFILSACGGGGGGGDNNSSSPAQSKNTAPVVTAVERVLVSAGDSVSLTASATDAEADTISYSWQQQNGDTVANTQGFDTATASFSAPDKVQTMQFQVTATAAGQSDTTLVQVIVLEDVDTAVFIDADFTGTSDGSIDAPLTDLEAALKDTDGDADFYIQTPDNEAAYVLWTDPSSIPNIRDGKSIYGGYTDDWSRDTSTNLTPITAEKYGLLFRDIDQMTTVSGIDLTVTQPTQDARTSSIGIYVDGGSSEFILENNNITLEGFAGYTSSSYRGANVFGFYTDDVDSVRVEGNTITTGIGYSASNRSSRTTGQGVDGGDGGDASVGNNEFGGAAGSGGDGWNGGKGGNAGDGFNEKGSSGSDGGGRTSPVFVKAGTGGRGGTAADGFRRGTSAVDGGNGVRGNGGSGASGYGSLLGDKFSTSVAESGDKGWSGGGGGGGGGGASSSLGADGGGGGGGGEGGGGGQGGFGGYSGGASMTLHIAGSTQTLISGNTLTAGDGAEGGMGGGGAAGGDGGEGGSGVQGFNDGSDNLRQGGNGGDGGRGGTGGAGGSGGGGPSFGIFIGANTPATIEDNTIVTGNGGEGGNANFTNETNSAGYGGWSVAIFDGDLSDSLTPEVANNNITLGTPGQDGNPKSGQGTAAETNF
jgi:hypothetical protein